MRESHQPNTVTGADGIGDEDLFSSDELEPRQTSADRFKVWVEKHRRDYDFNDLVPYYGTDFSSTLVDSWPAIFSHEQKGSSQKWFRALKRTLFVVSAMGESVPQSAAGQVYRHLRDRPREPLNVALFRDALQSVVQKLEDLSDKSISKSETWDPRCQFVYALNGVLRRLARYRLLPSIEPLTIRARRLRFKQTVPCLAELTPSGRTHVPVASGADLSLDAHVAAMLDLNVGRLAALRACLEREFIAEHEAFKRGQAWLMRTDLPNADAVDAAIDLLTKRKVLSQRGQRCGRKRDEWFAVRLKEQLLLDTDDELKAVMVRQAYDRLGGAWYITELSSPYRMLLSYFGSSEIVRHLESTARATTAAFGLLLIDTAFNVASLNDLPVDPFVSRARHGKRRIATISARKMRAKGRRVEGTLLGGGLIDGEEVDVPLRGGEGLLPGIEVISRYLEMTEPLRARARKQGRAEVAKKFWIVSGGQANGGAITNDLLSMASEWWPAFLKRNAADCDIGGLPITRRSIRATVLQVRAARSGFGHAIAQAVAEHASDATTMSYLGAGWFRAQLAKQMRAFQHLFEAALAKGLEHAATLLDIDETEFARRVAAAEDAGLDFGCPLHLEARTTPHDPAPTCNPAAPCDACPTRRFVPTDETFRLLYLAHTALKQAEPILIVQNPKRWLEVWLRWRALTEAYVLKIRRSPHKRQFERVAKAVDAEVRCGDVALPIIA